MIREYLKWHGHEVWTELGDCPHNRQAFQFGGRVRLFSLIQSLRSAADDALLAFPNLSQDSTEACRRGVGVQPECLAEVRKSCDRAGSKGEFSQSRNFFLDFLVYYFLARMMIRKHSYNHI